MTQYQWKFLKNSDSDPDPNKLSDSQHNANKIKKHGTFVIFETLNLLMYKYLYTSMVTCFVSFVCANVIKTITYPTYVQYYKRRGRRENNKVPIFFLFV